MRHLFVSFDEPSRVVLYGVVFETEDASQLHHVADLLTSR